MPKARVDKRSKDARKKARKKPPRVPFGKVRLKTQMSDEDMAEFKRRKMKTRWFNDVDGRIPRALAGGYKFVDPEYATSLGRGAIHRDNSDEGSKVSIIVSRGEPIIHAYLMEIPLRFWNADQADKEERVQKRERLDPAETFSGEDADKQYGPGAYTT